MFSVFVLLLVDFPEWSCLGLLVVLVSSLHYLKVGNLDGYSLGMWVWSVHMRLDMGQNIGFLKFW